MRCLRWSFIWLSLLTANAPAQTIEQHAGVLPCYAASIECARLLGDLAVSNSLEIRTLDQAAQLQRSKMWTSWMNADGLNPLAVVFRIGRNVAGGGDRAELRLAVAQLERRRHEVETELRRQVTQGLADLETAARRRALADSRVTAHAAAITMLEAGYRLGDGSTEQMLQLWSQGDELKGHAVLARADVESLRRKLENLVRPENSGVVGQAPAAKNATAVNSAPRF